MIFCHLRRETGLRLAIYKDSKDPHDRALRVTSLVRHPETKLREATRQTPLARLGGMAAKFPPSEKRSAGYQCDHVGLHALLVFVRPVGAGFELAGISWLGWWESLAFSRRLSRAGFEF